MRIIAGKHRGRRITMEDKSGIRPTSGMAREAIFNILMHGNFGRDGQSPLIGKRVVDIFCGTGALGLEALSRGAVHVTFIDKNGHSLALARENTECFGELEHAAFIRSDSTQLPVAVTPCSLAFADPPYNQQMSIPALKSLRNQGWLEQGAIVVLEVSTRDLIHLPEGYECMDERKYGSSKILIIKNL